MSSRNVAIRKDVYDALVKEKRPRESFTRLFERLLAQRRPLDELLGAWGRHAPAGETAMLTRWRRGHRLRRGSR